MEGDGGDQEIVVWMVCGVEVHQEGLMVDVTCFLCMDKNLSSPSSALKAPVSVLLPQVPANLVRHVEPPLSLLEAIDLILQGQNLVVPITSNSKGKNTS
ncbi:hypothetical protein RJ639_007525 [Escallonia herrerae]|uniref:Uncharacterized protein n=1 Tax=Escallonia herrerae TaxID=1293975 RepID=A0AA88VZ62_9ASTE|nr:hypothetical protein RJ639_007525 [Escallonia herrerae]